MHQPLSPSPSQFQETENGYRFLKIDSASDLAALQRAHPDRYPYVLQSSSQGHNDRFDILFGFPSRRLELAAPGELYDDKNISSKQFFDLLRENLSAEFVSESRLSGIDAPFSGGWFVFLAYEMVGQIETTLSDLPIDRTLPLAVATRIPVGIVVNHGNSTTTIIGDPAATPEQLEACLGDIRCDVRFEDSETNTLANTVEEDPARYLDSVATAKRYIREGDIFQANLSREWRSTSKNKFNAASLYHVLKSSNPAPFSGLAYITPDTAIISSSPERLVSVRGGVVSTRPIAGTHPRGQNDSEDQTLSRALLAHPKEKAEHIMLIDLERNDLGRICEPGSIKVDELMGLETYRHVHHIVSEVSGRLRASVDPVDVIKAVFPGGTITGCPKVRCMEIINQLENNPRGAYTGSLGYINRDGSLDLNILIRTLVCHGNTISLRAGAGIVADSDPKRELEETRAKAEGMLRALRPH